MLFSFIWSKFSDTHLFIDLVHVKWCYTCHVGWADLSGATWGHPSHQNFQSTRCCEQFNLLNDWTNSEAIFFLTVNLKHTVYVSCSDIIRIDNKFLWTWSLRLREHFVNLLFTRWHAQVSQWHEQTFRSRKRLVNWRFHGSFRWTVDPCPVSFTNYNTATATALFSSACSIPQGTLSYSYQMAIIKREIIESERLKRKITC